MELTKEYFDHKLGNLATKADLEQLARKEDSDELKTDITALQDNVRSVKTTLIEMNQILTALDQRDKEDSDAFAKTLVSQDERLNSLENEIKNLKLRQV